MQGSPTIGLSLSPRQISSGKIISEVFPLDVIIKHPRDAHPGDAWLELPLVASRLAVARRDIYQVHHAAH